MFSPKKLFNVKQQRSTNITAWSNTCANVLQNIVIIHVQVVNDGFMEYAI